MCSSLACVGKNAQDIGRIWADCYKQNRGGVVWRQLGRWILRCGTSTESWPVSRFIDCSGTCKDEVPIYSSTAWWETPQEYVEEALEVPGGRLDRAQDSSRTASRRRTSRSASAVREAVGDEMILMLDSDVVHTSYEDAVRVGRAIEELDYYWYEDPLAEEDLYSYVKLHQKLDIPIMSTEYAPGRYYGMTQWITQYATDILRGDVAVTGGITPLVRLCHLAEGFGLKCEIHHGGNSLNNVANLHVTMAVPNCEFFEYFPSDRRLSSTAWSRTSTCRAERVSAPTRAGSRLRDRLGLGEEPAHRDDRVGLGSPRWVDPLRQHVSLQRLPGFEEFGLV